MNTKKKKKKWEKPRLSTLKFNQTSGGAATATTEDDWLTAGS